MLKFECKKLCVEKIKAGGAHQRAEQLITFDLQCLINLLKTHLSNELFCI